MAANFKFVWQIENYFRKLVDESDNTFMSADDAAQYLEAAYDEFRFVVSDVDPQQYHKVVTTPTITLNEFDLTTPPVGVWVPVLGPLAANADRLQQLVRVTTVSAGSTPPVGTVLEPVYSYESLISVANPYWPSRYLLQGTKLLLSTVPSGPLRLEYIPQSTVNWANLSRIEPPGPPGNVEWIDDLIAFHDVIALLAARSYQMTDGATNRQVETQLAGRRAQLYEFLTRGRLVPANRFVAQDEPYRGM
jgi:hypothetical protein